MRRAVLCLATAAILVAGCANDRPVLYPNKTLQQHGKAAGDQAISACVRSAKANGLSYAHGRVVRRAAENGAVGGAGGAAAGAVYGNAGRGAAAGAAGGAAAGLIRGLFDHGGPSSAYRSYVNRCLRDRGYDPVGWQ